MNSYAEPCVALSTTLAVPKRELPMEVSVGSAATLPL